MGASEGESGRPGSGGRRPLADQQSLVAMRNRDARSLQLLLQLIDEARRREVCSGHDGNLIHRPSFARKGATMRATPS